MPKVIGLFCDCLDRYPKFSSRFLLCFAADGEHGSPVSLMLVKSLCSLLDAAGMGAAQDSRMSLSGSVTPLRSRPALYRPAVPIRPLDGESESTSSPTEIPRRPASSAVTSIETTEGLPSTRGGNLILRPSSLVSDSLQFFPTIWSSFWSSRLGAMNQNVHIEREICNLLTMLFNFGTIKR